ncbi:MAG: T9SS type A sorting domain-containing protein [Bacteroidia bacterium]|nr:T9SS type A sorting domain-containing protein [Bacteroidia bacterium]
MNRLLLLSLFFSCTLLAHAQYQGQPWGDANGGRWTFSSDNTTNLSVGSQYTKVTNGVTYNGIPAWAYDIGNVDTTGILPTADGGTLTAGRGGTQAGTGGFDRREENKGSRSLTTSDNAARTSFSGSSVFKMNLLGDRFEKGGAWTRYSCAFDSGQYVMLVRAVDACNGNFGSWVTLYDQSMNVVDSMFQFNQGVPDGSCANQLNVELLTDDSTNAPFDVLNKTEASHWVMLLDTFNLAGNLIVEISDTNPMLGGNAGARGVLGEFTFLYIGSYQGAPEPDPVFDVTIAVDMNLQAATSPDGVYAAGTFQEADATAATNCNNWSDNCTALEDTDNNGVWFVNLKLPAGDYQYKFLNGMTWGVNEGAGITADCGVDDGFGNFNRTMTVSSDTVIVYYYDSCGVSSTELVGSGSGDAIADPVEFSIVMAPNPMDESSELIIDNPQSKLLNVTVLSANGQLVKQWTGVRHERLGLDRSELSAGIYLVRVTDRQGRSYLSKLAVK